MPNLVRINDTPMFCWMISEQATFDLIKFLQERGHKVPFVEDRGLKFKGNHIDMEV